MTPIEVVRKSLACFTAEDRSGWIACASPDLVMDPTTPGPPGDINSWIGAYDSLHKAFTNARFEATLAVAEGEYVAGEMTFTGTHTGILDWPADPTGLVVNVPPSGEDVKVVFGFIDRVVNDQIVLDCSYGIGIGMARALSPKR